MDKASALQSIYNEAFSDEFSKLAAGGRLIEKGIGALRSFSQRKGILSRVVDRAASWGKKPGTMVMDINRPGWSSQGLTGSGYLARGARYMGTRHGNIAAGVGATGLGVGAVASPFKRDR